MRPFLGAILLHWPRARIDVMDERTHTWTKFRHGRMPDIIPPEGMVDIVRDTAMARHFERYGARLDKTQEGSLALFFWPGKMGEYNYNLVTPGWPLSNRFSRRALLLLIELAAAKVARVPEDRELGTITAPDIEQKPTQRGTS